MSFFSRRKCIAILDLERRLRVASANGGKAAILALFCVLRIAAGVVRGQGKVDAVKQRDRFVFFAALSQPPVRRDVTHFAVRSVTHVPGWLREQCHSCD
jgi:hypothetical protein